VALCACELLLLGSQPSPSYPSRFNPHPPLKPKQLDSYPHRLVLLLPPSPTQYSSLHRLAPRPYTHKLIGMVR
jgi:hypothetical protein